MIKNNGSIIKKEFISIVIWIFLMGITWETRMNIFKSVKSYYIAIAIIVVILVVNILIKKNFNKFHDSGLKKYEFLNKEDISTIPDDELVYAVMSWMWSKFNTDWSDDFEIISSLPKPCQDMYSVYIIEGEVNNGGFNQCYFNSSRQFTQMAEGGFQAMGAAGFADIMIRANTIYAEIKDDLEKYDDGTLESFSESYENNPLNVLDDEFYIMYEREPLNQLCIDYIRANSEYFGN